MHGNSCCHLFYVICKSLIIASFRLSNFSRSYICVVFILSCMPINPPHRFSVRYFSNIASFDNFFFLDRFLVILKEQIDQ